MTVSKTTIARLGRLQKVEILHKDGALNAEEFQIMRNHTIDGRNVLIGQPDVDPAWAESTYSHHEALDGTGYPRKIKASGISDLTRIVTICDVDDAITSDRCYRNGQSSLRAMDLLNHQPCEERVLDLQRVSGVNGQEGWLIRTVVPNGRLGVRVEEYVRRGLSSS